MKKVIFIISISIVAAILIGAGILYNDLFPLAHPIELPLAPEISSIEIKKGNGISIYSEKEEISKILTYFSSARRTRELVIHDEPVLVDYYTVRFLGSEESEYTSFIYHKNSKWYIEQPYYGIYKTEEEIAQFLPQE